MLAEIAWTSVMIAPMLRMACTCIAGFVLNGGNLRADLVGRASGLLGKRFHLIGDHREATAGFACTGRLDRCIERQQIGLRGDVVDQLDDDIDPVSGGHERLNGMIGPRGLCRQPVTMPARHWRRGH